MSSTTAASEKPLTGRTAVITGASRGIGLECARSLHGGGARVVLVARSGDALRHECVRLGRNASAVECDLADTASVQRALAAIGSLLGRAPEVLVNSAGLFAPAPFEATKVDVFERTLRVNLISQFAFAREFVPGMRERRDGHIVTIGSIADRQAYPENAAY